MAVPKVFAGLLLPLSLASATLGVNYIVAVMTKRSNLPGIPAS